MRHGGVSTGLHKIGYPSRSLVTAETVKYGHGAVGQAAFPDERKAGWRLAEVQERLFRPGTENKKPLTEMNPRKGLNRFSGRYRT